MTRAGSVTQLLGGLRAGEEQALVQLHRRCWPTLVALARRRLDGTPRRVADEEDVAQEAFLAFYQAFHAGRLPKLENRAQLFALLVTIASRKAATHVERAGRAKRGSGKVRGESALDALVGPAAEVRGAEQHEDPRPTAESEAIVKDLYQHYLGALADSLRSFAELYLAGWSHREIGERLGCKTRTVDRKVRLILDQWQTMAAREM